MLQRLDDAATFLSVLLLLWCFNDIRVADAVRRRRMAIYGGQLDHHEETHHEESEAPAETEPESVQRVHLNTEKNFGYEKFADSRITDN